MEFNVKHGALETIKCGCLVVAVNEGKTLSGPAADLDKACGGQLSTALKNGDLSGKSGSSLMLFALPGIAAQRVLLLGSGKDEALSDRAWRKLVQQALTAVKAGPASDAVFALNTSGVLGEEEPETGQQQGPPGGGLGKLPTHTHQQKNYQQSTECQF